jgi:vancomycin resistance protein YoaR
MTIPSFSKIPAKRILKSFLWFGLGAALGLFFFIGIVSFIYQRSYGEKIYPGVMVNHVDFGGKTQAQVISYFAKKNDQIQKTVITFTAEDQIATISARDLELGFDENLLAQQAYSVGRTTNLISNITLLFQAYVSGVNLPPAYHLSDAALTEILDPIRDQVTSPPADAQFDFENGKVISFKPSKDGKEMNDKILRQVLLEKVSRPERLPSTLAITIPMTIIKPAVTTESVNNMGIKELVGSGTSLFQHSISNRIYNISLASSKLNGILVPPGEVFSTVKALGDISSLSGYKSAYVISGGKTVLGDGGGVCQVSTTLFRAALAAGLPIVERNAHAYRVGYYEEDSGPGVDAAIYSPTVDFKFKNDTDKYILIQTAFDPVEMRLTFNLYGTKDGRIVNMTQPVITSQSPAPAPLYQDDPTLPVGTVQQVDFAAAGANVYFTREVTRNGQVLDHDTFKSYYRPWQAIYLRGTKT